MERGEAAWGAALKNVCMLVWINTMPLKSRDYIYNMKSLWNESVFTTLSLVWVTSVWQEILRDTKVPTAAYRGYLTLYIVQSAYRNSFTPHTHTLAFTTQLSIINIRIKIIKSTDIAFAGWLFPSCQAPYILFRIYTKILSHYHSHTTTSSKNASPHSPSMILHSLTVLKKTPHHNNRQSSISSLKSMCKRR
mgnify:CR=1 FL=1